MHIAWQPIETAPTSVPIDVYYVNDTFKSPVEGILRKARLRGNFWEGAAGSIPARFIVGWSEPSSHLRKAS